LSLLRGAVGQVVSLFVTDWTQTAGIAAILVFGFVASRQLHVLPVGFLIALMLAAHLVFTTLNEARRRSQQ
jgi:hypothetical protein